MGWIQNIFLTLAKRFGLELQQKPVTVDDYSQGVSLTAVIAHRVATLTMQDSTFGTSGTGARSRYMDNFVQNFAGGLMDVAAEVALGTGDCLIKPYTDGKRIGLDIIKNGDFVICDSIGDYIKSCIIKTGEIKTNDGVVYERYEVQKIRETNTLEINTIAYKNGVEVPLESVESWSGIPPVQYIPNVDYMLFGRYKCPTVNRQNVNGVNGVKITYGLDVLIQDALDAYKRFNAEYQAKETFIFADKTLFTRDKDGNVSLPKSKEKLFLKIRGQDDGALIQEYSPDIRAADLQTGIDVNFKMLELLAGLSNGILTPPSTSFATATEMRAALMATFAFMTRFRRIIDAGNRQLLQAVNVIANYNNLAPMGDWEYTSDWSTGYLEQVTEQYNRLLTANGIGAVSVAEVRAWVMDEDLETAEKAVQEIAEQTGADLMEEAARETEPPPDGE